MRLIILFVLVECGWLSFSFSVYIHIQNFSHKKEKRVYNCPDTVYTKFWDHLAYILLYVSV